MYNQATYIGHDVWLTFVALVFFLSLPVSYFFVYTIPFWTFGALIVYVKRLETKRLFMAVVYKNLKEENDKVTVDEVRSEVQHESIHQ